MRFRKAKHCDVIQEESLVSTYSPSSQCSFIYDTDRKTLNYDQLMVNIDENRLSAADLAPISDGHASFVDDGVNSSEILQEIKRKNKLSFDDMVDFTRTETESSQSSCSEFDFYSDSESIDDQDLELHEFSIPAAQSRRRSSEMPNACVDRLQVRISSRSYSKTPSFSKSSSSTNDPSSFNFRSSTSTPARTHAVETNLTAKKEYDDDFVPKTSTRRAESVLVSSRSTLGGVSFRFEQAPLQRKENSSSAYLTQDENSSLYSRLANLTRQLNNIDCIITSFEDLFSSGRRTLRPLASIINHELEQLKGSVHQLRCEGSALLRVYSDKVYATQLLSGVQRYVMHAKNTSARIDLLIVAIGSFKIRS